MRSDLAASGDPAKAPAQQSYMKSAMPFLGVSVPDVRRITRTAAAGEQDAAILLAAASLLWADAGYREQRYAAVQLLALRPSAGDPRTVPLIEHMVRTGRWWDFTDELAHRVADLLDARPAETARLVRAWSVDDEFWIRRLAILSQLTRRDRVDADLLADALAPNLQDREFFIRKAIGWALRDYARVAPDWVREYVATHELSPLSRREALKHL
ncbi:DNA alkylation repair protein [Microbacterium mangrovi]|uniref:DNA alkylation repair protein n=1 Tax=Microbacterium mangrovi TaxID=1348253 RepID=A0A0B2A6Z2_9MICO|nr:DNA alkylation repair protein [Microbacterium mangrovi]